MIVYFGTYTKDPGFLQGAVNSGIPYYAFNESDGALERLGLLPHPINPSFLCHEPKRGLLFSVAESESLSGETGAGIVTYRVDGESGIARQRDRVTGIGSCPCHCALDPNGDFLVASCYAGGSVELFSISDSGQLASRCVRQHEGSSADPMRQSSPHPHSALFDPSGQFAFVADLGTDKVFVYRLLREECRLEPHSLPFFEVPPGSGPRHLAYHGETKTLYVLNELSANISVIRFSAPFTSYRMLAPVAFPQLDPLIPGAAAEIAIHPNGRFLYASERSSHQLALFHIDPSTGLLSARGTVTTGKTPRHFAISPSGKWLLSAAQDEGTIQVWELDQSTGVPRPAGSPGSEPAVACVCFSRSA